MQDRLKFRRPIFTTGNLFCGFHYAEIQGGELFTTRYTGIVELNEFLTFGDWEQCTGLSDTNGNLMYENDLIRLRADDNTYITTRVVWVGGIFCPDGDREPFGNSRMWEIIGNIHTATVKDGE